MIHSPPLKLVTLPHQPPYGAAVLEEMGVRGLNIGSSSWPLRPGWLHLDIVRLNDSEGRATEYGRLASLPASCFYLEHDARKPFPLTDGIFEWVYSEHFIEHIPRKDAVAVLREVRRLLRPGGLLRLTTPDLERYLTAYVRGDRNFYEQHLRNLEAMLGSLSPEEALEFPREDMSKRPAWMVNQIFQHWGHRWIYDMNEMVLTLEDSGFDPRYITRRGFREGREPELTALDLPIRRDETLYVEAVRT